MRVSAIDPTASPTPLLARAPRDRTKARGFVLPGRSGTAIEISEGPPV
jgi:hypothetical protein